MKNWELEIYDDMLYVQHKQQVNCWVVVSIATDGQLERCRGISRKAAQELGIELVGEGQIKSGRPRGQP